MNLTIVHRYYWPDTPVNAQILRAVAIHAVDQGADVQVISSMPSYYGSDTRGVPRTAIESGVKVRRLRLLDERDRGLVRRVINSFAFSVNATTRVLFGPRSDIVHVGTTPPLIVAFPVALAARLRRAQVIYHRQDIYPEVLDGGGKNPGAIFLARVVRLLDQVVTRVAALNVVLSQDMRTLLATSRAVEIKRVRIINNFLTDDQLTELTQVNLEVGPGHSVAPLVFCGNMGIAQGLDSLVAAVARLENCQRDMPEPIVEMIGDGVKRNETEQLAEQIAPGMFRFHGYLGGSSAITIMAHCSAAIVCLADGVLDAAYPSKTLTYLGLGLQILLIGDPTTELARMIEENDLGLVAAPKDYEAIGTAIAELTRRAWTMSDRNRIRSFAHQRFGEEKALANWMAAFTEVL